MQFAKTSILVMSVLMASPAFAAPSFTWPVAPAITQNVSDPDEGLVKNAREILSADYAFDGTAHYFRITLEAAPTGLSSVTGNFAGNYGIYIDRFDLPGWSYLDTNYLPYPIQSVDTTGIDIALDAHWNFAGSGQNFNNAQHNHVANYAATGEYLYETLAGFNWTAGSNVLEFKLDASYLPAGTTFRWFAGTLDTGSEIGTYDLTAPSVVPEPASLGLLGLGGLLLLRRRK